MAAATLAASRLPAATFVVNSSIDFHDAVPGDGKCETAVGNGVCTLRAAIEEAEALAGADTIKFSAAFPVPTTFLLTLGHLEISTDLTITGNGAAKTMIDGDGAVTSDRVFLLTGGSDFTVTISSVTIRNGDVDGLRRRDLCLERISGPLECHRLRQHRGLRRRHRLGCRP